jgi:hypothetical protein
VNRIKEKMVLYFDDRTLFNKILDDAVSKLRVKAAIWKQQMLIVASKWLLSTST